MLRINRRRNITRRLMKHEVNSASSHLYHNLLFGNPIKPTHFKITFYNQLSVHVDQAGTDPFLRPAPACRLVFRQ